MGLHACLLFIVADLKRNDENISNATVFLSLFRIKRASRHNRDRWIYVYNAWFKQSCVTTNKWLTR